MSLWTRDRLASAGVEGAPPALRRLLETARSVAGRSRTVQIAVARLEGVVLAEHLPERVRADVVGGDRARRAPRPRGECPCPTVERELTGELDSIEDTAR